MKRPPLPRASTSRLPRLGRLLALAALATPAWAGEGVLASGDWLVPLLLLATGGMLTTLSTLLLRQWRRRDRDERRLLSAMLDNSPHVLALLTPDGRLGRCNLSARRWLHQAGHPMPLGERPVWDHELWQDHPVQREQLRQAIARAAGGAVARVELRLPDEAGGARVADLTVTPVAALPGQRQGHVLLEARDVTSRRLAEDKLMLASAVFEQTREGVLIADWRGMILTVNPAFSEITGFPADELQGQSLRLLTTLLSDVELPRAMRQGVSAAGHWQGEVHSLRRTGGLLTAWVSLSVRVDQDGRPSHLIAIVLDITAFRQVEQKLLRHDHFDGLTDLPNRQLLVDRLEQALLAAKRHQQPLALLFMDLNQLRHINDNFGHPAGDQVLQEVARRLRQNLREVDTVARLGGDEFAVLLPGACAQGAIQVADKLLERLAAPCHVADHEFSLTFSVGVALYPDDADGAEALLRCADAAMYRAKQEGRGRWCFYSVDMLHRSARQLQLEGALRRAEERGELQLHYQPQVGLNHGRLVGLEALIRWRHPELGMVSPAEFIPLAESSGQILAIGAWVLRTAVRQMKSWIDAGLPPTVVAVNLSAVQFRDPGLPELVQQVLQEAGLPPSCLELELTESVAAHNPQAARATMDQLHALGVRLSIDDFGTGFSSLSHLKRFPIHTVKIDQSFVRDISTDPDDRAIVQAIIQMARALRLTTIAEGVETDEQAGFLQEQGCAVAQGYRFCRPLAPADAQAWMWQHLALPAPAHAQPEAQTTPAGTVA